MFLCFTKLYRLTSFVIFSFQIFILPLITISSSVFAASKLADWTSAGFRNTRIYDFSSLIYNVAEAQYFTHAFDLDVLIVRGSGWTPHILLERYKHVAFLFSQCNTKIENFRIIIIDAPSTTASYFPGDLNLESTGLLAERIPIIQKPITTVIHVNSLANGQTGYSGPQWYYGLNHPRAHRHWISYSVVNNENSSALAQVQTTRHVDSLLDKYSVEAHEIGHDLFNSRHIYDQRKNLMSGEWGFITGHIRQSQCDQLYKHHLVRKFTPKNKAIHQQSKPQ